MLSANIQNIFLDGQDISKVLLSGIRISLPGNSVYTILGKNGSGKSTLIKALTGLLDKRFYTISGEVLWKGKDLLSINQRELIIIRRKEIRYVFQDSLNSLDPLKKIKYYFDTSNISKNKIEELLAEFTLPEYDSIADKHPYELSGGMLQRLNFVLTLAVDPELIILDEPTSAIDSVNSLLAFKAIRKFVRGGDRSALIVTQDIFFAERVSDKIAFLENGSLTAFINTADFLRSGDNRIKNFVDAHKELNI